MNSSDSHAVLFEVETPFSFRVRTTAAHWTAITTVKHPALREREADIQAVLRNPDQVRQSNIDDQVLLFYRSDGSGRWLCVVVRRLNGEGFIITAYRTSPIKEGNQVWTR